MANYDERARPLLMYILATNAELQKYKAELPQMAEPILAAQRGLTNLYFSLLEGPKPARKKP